MSNFLKRFSKRMRILGTDLKRDIFNFPMNITFVNLLKNISSIKGPFEKIYNWCENKRDNQILDYLYKTNKNVFDKYKDLSDSGVPSSDKYIWICWFQGEETAPTLVKKCIASIKKHAQDYKVIIIDETNISNYIKLPKVILNKYNSGNISKAHFSDILRTKLINTYGGLWLDATIFCTKSIPDEIFNYSFFTCKSPIKKCKYISEYQWTTFVLGGKKNSIFYKFMSDFYDSYWLKNKVAIDYLFMDYVIALAKKHIKAINELIEKVPINNLLRDEIQAVFDEPFEIEKYNQFLNSDTYLFKLSWRMNFKKLTEDGKETFYGYFINN